MTFRFQHSRFAGRFLLMGSIAGIVGYLLPPGGNVALADAAEYLVPLAYALLLDRLPTLMLWTAVCMTAIGLSLLLYGMITKFLNQGQGAHGTGPH